MAPPRGHGDLLAIWRRRSSHLRSLSGDHGYMMALAAADQAAVRALWRKLNNNVGVYTTEALERCGQA